MRPRFLPRWPADRLTLYEKKPGVIFSADPPVAVEVGADALFETLNHGAKQLLRASQIGLQPFDPLLERRGPIALRRNLALLVEVPEHSHTRAV